MSDAIICAINLVNNTALLTNNKQLPKLPELHANVHDVSITKESPNYHQ
jgi:hypothetical protein